MAFLKCLPSSVVCCLFLCLSWEILLLLKSASLLHESLLSFAWPIPYLFCGIDSQRKTIKYAEEIRNVVNLNFPILDSVCSFVILVKKLCHHWNYLWIWKLLLENLGMRWRGAVLQFNLNCPLMQSCGFYHQLYRYECGCVNKHGSVASPTLPSLLLAWDCCALCRLFLCEALVNSHRRVLTNV